MRARYQKKEKEKTPQKRVKTATNAQGASSRLDQVVFVEFVRRYVHTDTTYIHTHTPISQPLRGINRNPLGTDWTQLSALIKEF